MVQEVDIWVDAQHVGKNYVCKLIHLNGMFSLNEVSRELLPTYVEALGQKWERVHFSNRFYEPVRMSVVHKCIVKIYTDDNNLVTPIKNFRMISRD